MNAVAPPHKLTETYEGVRSNTLHKMGPRVTGIMGLHPLPQCDSNPRLYMFIGHVIQALEIADPEPPFFASGVEIDFGKYALGEVLEHDTSLLGNKIPKFVGHGKWNPTDYYFSEIEVNGQKQIDLFDLPKFRLTEYKFGFDTKMVNDLKPHMPAGYRLDAPPSYDDVTGAFNYGLNTTILMCTHPFGIEDGYAISEDLAERLGYTTFTRSKLTLKPGWLPLNMYPRYDGDYRILPDLGERVRDDGILFASRNSDADLAPLAYSEEGMKVAQHNSNDDRIVYVEPGSLVVDISIQKSSNLKKDDTPPEHIVAQLEEMYQNQKKQAAEIIRKSKEYTSSGIYSLTDRARISILEMYKQNPDMAMSHIRNNKGESKSIENKLKYVYKRNHAIGVYRIVVTLRSFKIPCEANKVTGRNGDKGVIVSVQPTDKMPFLKAANRRAHIVGCIDGSVNRLNGARPIEPYCVVATQDWQAGALHALETGEKDKQELRVELTRLAQIVNEHTYHIVLDTDGLVDEAYFQSIVIRQEPLQIQTMGMNPEKVIGDLVDEFPCIEDHVTMWNEELGMFYETEEKMMIGCIYLMLLEKVADDAVSTSSSLLTPYGTPAKLQADEKQYHPISDRAVRNGESEWRWYNCVFPGESGRLFAYRSNDMSCRMSAVRSILETDKPSAIKDVLKYADPKSKPRTSGIAEHLLQLGGIGYGKVDYTENN